MRLLARITILSIFAVFIIFCTATTVKAEGEFETDYKVRYSTDTSGITTVTQNISLKNKTDNFYADKFELKIGSTKVSNVEATDELGNLETETKFENNVTSISVRFKQKVIGLGKTLNWTLSYDSAELATKSGQIWEISIPKVAKSGDAGIYETTVVVPRSFGPQAFAIPTPISQNQTNQGQEFFFNKDQLTESGISMSFGEKQVFSFKLNYNMENSNVTAQIDQISLPPDNNYQKVVLEKIEPKPQTVEVDEDGNFIASYRLSPKEKKTVTVEGYVEVFSKPFRKIVSALSDEQKSIYTQPQQYWETDNAFIKEKAQELKSAEEIYKFVEEFLSYSNERLTQANIERKGAVGAYTSPNDAVCTEFTDLFIAIARAAGIPAREVEGYAYTQNERLRPLSLSLYQGDILHAWPEYWDNDLGWVQVDPTWGSTSGGLDYFNKLDFNHITFVQRGLSSTKPYPAGAYLEGTEPNQKTVFVSFAAELPNPTSSAEIDIKSADKIFSLFPLRVNVNLKNTGSTSIIGETLSAVGGNLKTKSQTEEVVAILPPFAQKQFVYNFETNNMLSRSQENLIFSFGATQLTKPIMIAPFYLVFIEPTFVIGLIGSIIIIATGLILYKKMHKRTYVPKA